MPNIASALKTEISRLARREIKRETAAIQAASARHRRDIAALKRAIAELDRSVRQIALTRPKATLEAADGKGRRFRPDGLKSYRARLGISAEDMGKLLEVSGQTIYLWEQRKSVPRASQLARVAALRGLGKREVAARLDAMAKRTTR